LSRQETENGAVIVFGSIYGNTQRMAEAIARSLSAAKAERVRVHNVSRTHLSFILTDTWRFRGLILGSATYNTQIFPLVENFMRLLENLKLRGRCLGLFGTYGWSGGAVRRMKEFAGKGRWDLVEPRVEANFAPNQEDLRQCALLGQNLASRLLA